MGNLRRFKKRLMIGKGIKTQRTVLGKWKSGRAWTAVVSTIREYTLKVRITR